MSSDDLEVDHHHSYNIIVMIVLHNISLVHQLPWCLLNHNAPYHGFISTHFRITYTCDLFVIIHRRLGAYIWIYSIVLFRAGEWKWTRGRVYSTVYIIVWLLVLSIEIYILILCIWVEVLLQMPYFDIVTVHQKYYMFRLNNSVVWE